MSTCKVSSEGGAIDITLETTDRASRTGFIGNMSAAAPVPQVPPPGVLCEATSREYYEQSEPFASGTFGQISYARETGAGGTTPNASNSDLVIKTITDMREYKNIELDPPRLGLAFNSAIKEGFYNPEERPKKVELVMPRYHPDLDKAIKQRESDRTAWTSEEAHDLASQLAYGIWQLHLAGMIHRDLKPLNIMFDHIAKGSRSGGKRRLVLIDYGLVEDGCGKTSPYCANNGVGSPFYMSRAQWIARSETYEYGASVDWHAWALIVFQIYVASVNVFPFGYTTRAESTRDIYKALNEPVDLGLLSRTPASAGDRLLPELLHSILSDEMRVNSQFSSGEADYYEADPRLHPVLKHAYFYQFKEPPLPVGWRKGYFNDGNDVWYVPHTVGSEVSVKSYDDGGNIVDKKVLLYSAERRDLPPPEKATRLIVHVPAEFKTVLAAVAGVYARLADASHYARYKKENKASIQMLLRSGDGGQQVVYQDQEIFLYRAKTGWRFYRVLGAEGGTHYASSLSADRTPPTTSWEINPILESMAASSANSLRIEYPMQYLPQEYPKYFHWPAYLTVKSTLDVISGTYQISDFLYDDMPNYKKMKYIAVNSLAGNSVMKVARLYYQRSDDWTGWWIGPDMGSRSGFAFFPASRLASLGLTPEDYPPNAPWWANDKPGPLENMTENGANIQITPRDDRLPLHFSKQGVFWQRLCDDYHYRPAGELPGPASPCEPKRRTRENVSQQSLCNHPAGYR